MNGIELGISYTEYMHRFEQCVQEGRTSGSNQSADLIEYTKLNLHRSQRIERTLALDNAALLDLLKHWECPVYFLVLSEFWCGDAAQNLPLLAMLERANPEAIRLRIVFRDENPELMDAYLTGGGRSIPKLVVVDAATGQELAVWGPRPQAIQPLVQDYKSRSHLPGTKEQFIKDVQLWYAKDKGQSFQNDFVQLLQSIEQPVG